jgi:hypothetical protein
VILYLFTLPDLLSQENVLESLDPLMPTCRSSTVTTNSGLASGGIFSVEASKEEDASNVMALTSLGSFGIGNTGQKETSNLTALSGLGTGTSVLGAGGPLPADNFSGLSSVGGAGTTLGGAGATMLGTGSGLWIRVALRTIRFSVTFCLSLLDLLPLRLIMEVYFL